MTELRLVLAAAVAGLGAWAGGCAPVAPGEAPGPGEPGRAGVAGPPAEEELLVPPGYGTLHQEDLTLELRDGEVRVRVTPLEEWMLRLTAPDTYRRLSGLALEHRPVLEGRTRVPDPTLFLVSVYSDEPGSLFHPEDLYLENRVRRFRPLAIHGLTPGWGTRRLRPRDTQMAVYAFDPRVDFDVALRVEYREDRTGDWAGILRTLEAELARARARAGGGG